MNRATRLLRYMAVMFPPGSHLPQALALFVAIYGSMQALAGIKPLRFGWEAAVGAAVVVVALLLVRLYDDVRDAPADLRLGLGGDPRYVMRPTVVGMVSISEVRWLVAALSLGLGILHLAWGGPRARLVFLAGFSITWLAFRWFFLPLPVRVVPMATLARKALTILVAAYVVAVFADEWSPVRLSAWTWLLLLVPCLEAAAWEVSRKIRAPGDETDYDTYSKVLGPRRAATLAVGSTILATICLLLLAFKTGIGWAYPAVLLGATLLLATACARFIRNPTREGANLRPYAELFSMVANGGLAAAVCIRFGVVVR